MTYEGWFVLLALILGMLVAYSMSADASLIRQMRKVARDNGGKSPVTLEVTKRGKYSFTYVLDNPEFNGHKTFTECNRASTSAF